MKNLLILIILLNFQLSFGQVQYFSSKEACDYKSSGCDFRPLETKFKLDETARTFEMVMTINGNQSPKITYHIKKVPSEKDLATFTSVDEYGNWSGVTIGIDFITGSIVHITKDGKSTLFKLEEQ